MSRRLSAGVLAALLPLVAVACSDDGTTSESSNPRVQVRPVLGECTLTGTATDGAPPVDVGVGFALQIDGATRVCPAGPGFAVTTVRKGEVTNTAPGVAIAVVELTDADLVKFNEIAAQCYAGTPVCPTRKISMTLDGEIVSVANVQVPAFEGELQLAFNDEETAQRTLDALEIETS